MEELITEERKKEMEKAKYRNYVLGQLLQILTKDQFCKFMTSLMKQMEMNKFSPGEMLDSALDTGVEVIMSAFPWMTSDEGHEFWSKIDDKFQKRYKPYSQYSHE